MKEGGIMIDAASFNFINELDRRLTQTERNMRTVLKWMHDNGHLDRIMKAQDEHKTETELSDSHQ